MGPPARRGGACALTSPRCAARRLASLVRARFDVGSLLLLPCTSPALALLPPCCSLLTRARAPFPCMHPLPFAAQLFCVDLATKGWHALKPAAAAAGAAGAGPCARGWFAAAAPGGQLTVHGGLDVDNQRLGDVWVLEH